MKKKTRTILFSIFVFLFFLISPSVILYSKGYRLDLENKKIVRTGGLFLKTFPKKTEIYLDGKFKKGTSLIFGTVLIENLLPKRYKVEVKKEGYFPWKKSLEIKEGQVTEVKDLILFPKNLPFEIFLSEIEDFWLLPEKKIVLYEKGKNGWFLSIYDFKKGAKEPLISEKEISIGGAILKELEISENSKEIDLSVEIEKEIKKFSLSIERFPPILTEKIENLPPDIVALQEIENSIYYLDKSGFFFKTNRDFRGKLRLNWDQFKIREDCQYRLMNFGDWFFLKENGRLYFLNREKNSFEKIFDSISDLKISPDGRKLAIFSEFEIWVLYLIDKEDQPRKKAGEKTFLTRLSKKIGNLFWLNSNYLIFNSGNEIKISEIDDRDKINIYDLLEFEKPKIYFFDKKIFILSNGNLYLSESLIH
jgi:hypothetical protein